MPGANVTDADIAAAFDQIADRLELQDADAFRLRAYRNAARMVGELKFDLTDIHCRMAKDEGVPVAINSDASHSPPGASLHDPAC